MIAGARTVLGAMALLILVSGTAAAREPGQGQDLPAGPGGDRVMTLQDAVDFALRHSFALFELQEEYLQYAYQLESARRSLRTNVHLRATVPGIAQSINPQLLNTGAGEQELVFIRDSSTWMHGGIDIVQPLITNGRIAFSSNLVGFDASRDLPDRVVRNRSVQPSMGIRFRQPLFQYNEVRGTLRQAELSFENLRLSYTEQELELINRVTRQFYDLYAQQSALELAQQRFEQSDRNYQSGVRREQAGLIPEVDVLRLEVSRSNDLDALESARHRLEQRRFVFNRLVGLPLLEQVYAVAELTYRPIAVDLDQALEKAFASRSDLRRAAIELEGRRLKLEETVSQGRPNLQLQIDYDITGNSSLTALPGDTWSYHLRQAIETDNRSPNTNVSITVQVPVFDWGRNAARVLQGTSEIRVQEQRRQEVRQELVRIVTDRVRAVESAMRRFEIQEQNVQVVQISYDVTRLKFDRGEIAFTELAQALEQLSQTLTNRLNAQIAYELAKADLKEITLWDWDAGQAVAPRTVPPQPFDHRP